jgi:predicted membrane-bound mannosyltransferase
MKTQRRHSRVERIPRRDIGTADGSSSDNVKKNRAEQPAHSVELETNGRESDNGQEVETASASPTSVPTLPKRRRSGEAASSTTVVSEPPQRPASRSAAPARPDVEAEAGSFTPTTSAVPPLWRIWLTYENAIYFGIFLITIFTRFHDLGNRGIHHDESLHSVYGRNLYIGNGYTHDPMMHGPLQFNYIALMDWLFGTSDATARFASVVCGIWVVMSPYFLRRQMGKIPALICSILLLVSPSILYFSRMAREDAIYSGMEMIMIVGLWRFITTRKPADFYIFCAGLALMFTIKETAYLTTAVLGGFFLLLFAYQAGYAILGAVAGYLATIGGFFLIVNSGMKSGSIAPLPNIPAQSPSYEMIMDFATNLVKHPLFIGSVIITLIYAVLLIVLFRRKRSQLLAQNAPASVVRRRVARPATQSNLPSRRVAVRPASDAVSVAPSQKVTIATNGKQTIPAPPATIPGEITDGVEDGREEVPDLWDANRLDPKPGSLLSHYEPGSLPHLVGALFSRPWTLVIGFLIAATIFTVLYTVFFTDIPHGLASGLFASLGYWMAQQGVARGGQPWYYYLLLVPLYEPIAVFFALAASVFFSWRGIRWLLRNREERIYNDEPHLAAYNLDRPVPLSSFSSLLPAFMIVWLFGVLFLYSWAGEKMPWLMMHMARPAVFLASLFLGALATSLITRRRERLTEAGLLVEPVEGDGVEKAPSVGGNGNLPARKRAGGSRAQARPAVLASEAPPWETWNRPDSRFPALAFVTLFTLFAIAWGLLMNYFIAKQDYTNWGWTWLLPVAMVALVVGYALWLGPGRALRYLALGILVVMLGYQFRSSIMLSYNQPDVPKEMATYVQTSPDVTRTIHELETFADYYAGGKDNMKVMYDSFTSWPMEWYLRDYKQKIFIGASEANPDASTPVLLLEYAKHNNDQKLLQDYVQQRYAMRWWFPEEWYKQDLIPGLNYQSSPLLDQAGGILRSAASTVTDPQNQASLWKYILFRETPKPLGSEDMIVFLRRDIAQEYHRLQYLPPSYTDLPRPNPNPQALPLVTDVR